MYARMSNHSHRRVSSVVNVVRLLYSSQSSLRRSYQAYIVGMSRGLHESILSSSIVVLSSAGFIPSFQIYMCAGLLHPRLPSVLSGFCMIWLRICSVFDRIFVKCVLLCLLFLLRRSPLFLFPPLLLLIASLSLTHTLHIHPLLQQSSRRWIG